MTSYGSHGRAVHDRLKGTSKSGGNIFRGERKLAWSKRSRAMAKGEPNYSTMSDHMLTTVRVIHRMQKAFVAHRRRIIEVLHEMDASNSGVIRMNDILSCSRIYEFEITKEHVKAMEVAIGVRRPKVGVVLSTKKMIEIANMAARYPPPGGQGFAFNYWTEVRDGKGVKQKKMERTRRNRKLRHTKTSPLNSKYHSRDTFFLKGKSREKMGLVTSSFGRSDRMKWQVMNTNPGPSDYTPGEVKVVDKEHAKDPVALWRQNRSYVRDRLVEKSHRETNYLDSRTRYAGEIGKNYSIADFLDGQKKGRMYLSRHDGNVTKTPLQLALEDMKKKSGDTAESEDAVADHHALVAYDGEAQEQIRKLETRLEQARDQQQLNVEYTSKVISAAIEKDEEHVSTLRNVGKKLQDFISAVDSFTDTAAKHLHVLDDAVSPTDELKSTTDTLRHKLAALERISADARDAGFTAEAKAKELPLTSLIEPIGKNLSVGGVTSPPRKPEVLGAEARQRQQQQSEEFAPPPPLPPPVYDDSRTSSSPLSAPATPSSSTRPEQERAQHAYADEPSSFSVRVSQMAFHDQLHALHALYSIEANSRIWRRAPAGEKAGASQNGNGRHLPLSAWFRLLRDSRVLTNNFTMQHGLAVLESVKGSVEHTFAGRMSKADLSECVRRLAYARQNPLKKYDTAPESVKDKCLKYVWNTFFVRLLETIASHKSKELELSTQRVLDHIYNPLEIQNLGLFGKVLREKFLEFAGNQNGMNIMRLESGRIRDIAMKYAELVDLLKWADIIPNALTGSQLHHLVQESARETVEEAMDVNKRRIFFPQFLEIMALVAVRIFSLGKNGENTDDDSISVHMRKLMALFRGYSSPIHDSVRVQETSSAQRVSQSLLDNFD